MTSSRNYETLREEIVKKNIALKEALEASNSDNVIIDGITVSRKSAENLRIDFENFLNSDSAKFRRIFIPINMIHKDVYWKNLQALFNKVYDSQDLSS